jgi:hypothetical protein
MSAFFISRISRLTENLSTTTHPNKCSRLIDDTISQIEHYIKLYLFVSIPAVIDHVLEQVWQLVTICVAI